MKNRTEHLFDLYQVESSKDLAKILKNFSSITNCMFKLVQELSDKKVEIKYHNRELESKYIRFGIANQSLVKLISGVDFLIIDKLANSIDVDSLYSITRMQIETYLILYYLNYDTVSDNVKDFRYDIYKLHGLRKHLDAKIPNPDSEKTELIKKIEIEIERLLVKIKQSSIYLEATTSRQKCYLEPNFAKLIKSEIIFSKSGISNSRINEMWKIYSNYAHAEQEFNVYLIIHASFTANYILYLIYNTNYSNEKLRPTKN